MSTPTRPRRHYAYVDQGAAIYAESFATIRREARLDALPPGAETAAVRMVHGTGQVDLVDDLVVHHGLVAAARTALRSGAPILTDAHMVASGVTRARLPRDNDVVCLLRDDRVADLARQWGTTRSAAAVSLWNRCSRAQSSRSATPPPRCSTSWRSSSTAPHAPPP
jgi:precorrin-8X/cobalt-precorrin-8 methylmutase